jgi:signal transduction histidine kinase
VDSASLSYVRTMRVNRSLRPPPLAVDALVATLFAAAAFASVHATLQLLRGSGAKFVEPGDPRLVAALIAITLPLALRRRFPRSVAAIVIAAFLIGRLVLPLEFEEAYVSVWACYLAIYTAARYSPATRWSQVVVAALVLALVGEITREILFAKDLPPGAPLTRWFLFFYNVAVLMLPVILAVAVRLSNDRQRQLRAQTVELEHEREENARRAVLEERMRIARELHDVVAHHVSVIGIQAGAARRVAGTRPEKVQEVLGTIESSSREAVVELHRLLGVLRRSDQADGIAPQPTLAELDALVAKAGQSDDLTVELLVEGERRELSPSLELSAYRVVQEALTNVLKHSAANSAVVRVGYGNGALEVDVADNGHGRAHVTTAAPTGGNGLIGMRERVRLHGGHLSAGPRRAGGFSVRASFPLEADRA